MLLSLIELLCEAKAIMRRPAAICAAIGTCLFPYLASAQTAGPVSLVLVTWVQTGGAAGTAATAQSVIGTFNDVPACIAAAQKTQLTNGATALSYNFLCVPNK
jgi:hypothetical protein